MVTTDATQFHKMTGNPKRPDGIQVARMEFASLSGGQTMGAISRFVASLRGEQCFITVYGCTEAMTYRRGQEIVAGDRSYVVTRIMRARSDPRVPSWEIWARPAKR
jgi:hypothetical protein